MPFGNALEARQEAPGHGGDRQAMAFADRPEPVHRAILVPAGLFRADQRIAQPHHARQLAPGRQTLGAFRRLGQRHLPEDGEAPRMMGGSGDRLFVAARVPADGGMDDGRIHPGHIHLGQQFLCLEGRYLAVMAGWRAAPPEMHLRIDDAHPLSPRARARG